MKTKKKLVLGKQTISRLNEAEMRAQKGGVVIIVSTIYPIHADTRMDCHSVLSPFTVCTTELL